MKIEYYPETDSLYIKLKPGIKAEGAEVAPGIVLHYTPDAEVAAVEMDSMASKLVDLSRLEVEGLPVSVTREERRESQAG